MLKKQSMRLLGICLGFSFAPSYRWWSASHDKSCTSEDLGKVDTKVGGDKMAVMNLILFTQRWKLLGYMVSFITEASIII